MFQPISLPALVGIAILVAILFWFFHLDPRGPRRPSR
jgi:hypothetical protein